MSGFLIHDRGAGFTAAFGRVFRAAGTGIVRSAIQAPGMNLVSYPPPVIVPQKLMVQTAATEPGAAQPSTPPPPRRHGDCTAVGLSDPSRHPAMLAAFRPATTMLRSRD
jgi:hypothetical protein